MPVLKSIKLYQKKSDTAWNKYDDDNDDGCNDADNDDSPQGWKQLWACWGHFFQHLVRNRQTVVLTFPQEKITKTLLEWFNTLS